jgi:hypothetical protein
MKVNKPGGPRQPSKNEYLIISAVSFAVSLFCVYYYLHSVQGNTNSQTSSQVFYLILIIFGVAISILLFGVMRSYALLKGVQFGAKYRFSGPIVGVILVVVGGFYLPKGTGREILSVTIVDRKHVPIDHGKVTISFAQFSRQEMVDNNGKAVFPDVVNDDLVNMVKFDVQSDGYDRLVLDTTLHNTHPIEMTLSPVRVIHISGTVTDANDMPIRDVTVMVDGTNFHGLTISNGSFSFDIVNYSIGDAINLVTSHKSYRDKTVSYKITSRDMQGIGLVLAPLNHYTPPDPK